MRIEKIELNKVRVTLFSEDLRAMQLNRESLRPDSPELHTFLLHIMQRVQRETGFDPYNGQVVVEATPIAEGLVLMVSKLPLRLSPKHPQKVRRVTAKKRTPRPSVLIYRFETLPHLTESIRLCPDTVQKGTLYFFREAYHLVLKSEKIHNVLREFSSVRRDSGLGEQQLAEHGVLVAKNAEILKLKDL